MNPPFGNCFVVIQLYQKQRFHAILLPEFIEFSRCIGTYSSAKFEFIIYLFGLVINRFLLLKIRMKQKATTYSALNVGRKILYLIIAIVLYHTCYGDQYWSLVVAVTVAEVILLFIAYWCDGNCLKIKEQATAASYKQLISYGIPFVFSTTITYIFHSTDKLMLNALADYTQVGLYSGAQNIVNLMTQVQTVFTTFWVPVAYERYSRNPDDKEFFIKINKIVSYVMVMIFITLLCAKELIILFLGPQYREAEYVFPFLAFMPIMYTVSETTVMGINFKKKTKYHVWISIICASINTLGNYFLITHFGAKGAAISTGLSYVVFWGLRTIFANKVYPIKYAIGRYIIMCLLVFILALLASFIKVNIKFIFIAVIIMAISTFLYRDVIADGKKILIKFWRSKVTKG